MVAYAYRIDKPTTSKKAETYVMGVSELCVLPDGRLLVLEALRLLSMKMKLGAFCKCKLDLVNPLQENPYTYCGNLSVKLHLILISICF